MVQSNEAAGGAEEVPHEETLQAEAGVAAVVVLEVVQQCENLALRKLTVP
jgi:hypothetical protein